MFAFFAFCLISSIVYIINDIVDREADKLHPTKRNRPLASGALSIIDVIVIALVLFASLIYLTPFINVHVWYIIAFYGILNITYSLWLKKVILVDVFIIAAGFMLRVLAGAFAIDVEISSWLVLCTLFVSVFLGISKRRGELILSMEDKLFTARPVLKQYSLPFMDQMITVAASGMTISYALYTVAQRTVSTFKTENLIFTTVFVLFGVFRYIFIMQNRKTDDNPMHLLLTDVPMVVNMIAWFLVCVAVIYSQEIIR
jgi:4-hydroxybenzoate polyprenyltransferase